MQSFRDLNFFLLAGLPSHVLPPLGSQEGINPDTLKHPLCTVNDFSPVHLEWY